MPGRYGLGQGHNGRQRKVFFMESCLLVLLQRKPGYGYSLMNELKEFGLEPDSLDISVLYRALKELEGLGLVRSNWDEQISLGPKRRIYSLTDQGNHVLARWIESLSHRREEIEKLEKAYFANQQKNIQKS